MSTLAIKNARPGFAANERDAREGSWHRRAFRRIWDILVQIGERRAHREIILRMEARGVRVTGDFDSDVQRYSESLAGLRSPSRR